MGGMKFIQSAFRFKTRVGKGRGVVRSANVGPEEWRAWTVYTVLERLDGHDEVEARREKEQSTRSSSSGAVPSSTRSDGDVHVLVIGTRPPGVGDSWRNRYETIKLHTPSYTDHYAFLKFPTNWPRYPNRDQIANWMEHYASIMELKIQHDTEAKKIAYDESAKKYLFELKGKDGTTWTVTAKHAVLASGLFNDNIPRSPYVRRR
ncbi:hypothetical protein BDV10DRAFT_22600 [Aspergillus recurvatus]